MSYVVRAAQDFRRGKHARTVADHYPVGVERYFRVNNWRCRPTVHRWIERRTSEDKWVFWGGVVITLIVMYYVLRWVGRL